MKTLILLFALASCKTEHMGKTKIGRDGAILKETHKPLMISATMLYLDTSILYQRKFDSISLKCKMGGNMELAVNACLLGDRYLDSAEVYIQKADSAKIYK